MSHARWAEDVVVQHPGRPTPAIVRYAKRFLAPLVRVCHRPTLTGTENLPENGPFLLVANHSAGLGVAEILSFLAMYLEHVGPERPLSGFALPLGFRVYPISALLHAVGAIPSTYEAGHDALASGVPLLIFPGGDHETLRPIWQAHRVDFGGRVGFLRMARDAGVPIVPLGIRGAHFTAPMLFRSRALATVLVLPRLLGSKRWGLSLLGAIGAVLIGVAAPWSWPLRALAIWLWLGSPLTFMPWIPWTLRMRIGAPLAPADLFANDRSDASLRTALPRVQFAVQSLVDR